MPKTCSIEMWAFSRRLLSHNKLIRRNLLRRNDAIVGCFNSKPCFTRGKQDNTSDDSFKVSRLFEPNPVKESTDSILGVELTGQISKSDILKVLNRFSQKKENRNLCVDYGLDGNYCAAFSMNLHRFIESVKSYLQNIFRRNRLPVFVGIVFKPTQFRQNFISNCTILSMRLHIPMIYSRTF